MPRQTRSSSLQFSLNQLVKELDAKNPAILASLARTNAAAASVRAVRSWEDPIARVGGIGAREELRASDGDLLYGVEQKLPLFGKPARRRRVALAGWRRREPVVTINSKLSGATWQKPPSHRTGR